METLIETKAAQAEAVAAEERENTEWREHRLETARNCVEAIKRHMDYSYKDLGHRCTVELRDEVLASIIVKAGDKDEAIPDVAYIGAVASAHGYLMYARTDDAGVSELIIYC